jgi:RecA/RadA recombinase
MSSLTEFLKCTGNEFASVADSGIAAGDVSGWVDSGSYALNAVVSGSIYRGFPQNKITALAADSGTGKTFFALGAAKNFLEQNPDGIVMCFESESAITKDMLVDRGIDVKRFGVVPVTTVQEFRTQCIKVVDNYEKEKPKDRVPLMFILDSLGMLSTSKEMEDTATGADTKDMTRAGMIKATFRVLTLKLGRANIPMLITNHVYADVGGGLYAQKVVGGGSGLIYSSSTILQMTKAKDKDSDGIQSGVFITVTATKSRLTKENSRVRTLVRFDGGLDRYYGCLDLAEEAGIFKKVSTRFELPDGSKVFGTVINKNPTKYFTKEILDQIDVYCQKKFMYGGEEAAENIDEETEEEAA